MDIFGRERYTVRVRMVAEYTCGVFSYFSAGMPSSSRAAETRCKAGRECRQPPEAAHRVEVARSTF